MSTSTTTNNAFGTIMVFSSLSLSELKLAIRRALTAQNIDVSRFYDYMALAAIVYRYTKDEEGNSFLVTTNQTRVELPVHMCKALVTECPERIRYPTPDGGSSWVDPEETVAFRKEYGFTVQKRLFDRDFFGFQAERTFTRDGKTFSQRFRNDALFVRFPTDESDPDWVADQSALIVSTMETLRRSVIQALGLSDKSLTHETAKHGILVKFDKSLPLGCRELIRSWYHGRVTSLLHAQGEEPDSGYFEFNNIRVDWARDLRDRSMPHRNSKSHTRV